MRIAVAYDNDEVFQHFGRIENFIVSKMENNQITKLLVYEMN